MRLRTRLALLFALLAVAPLTVIVPFAARDLDRTLSRGLDARVKGAEAAVEEDLSRTAESVTRSVDELAGSVALETFARTLEGPGPRAEVAAAAQALMGSRGLSVLSLLDAKGTTLSSGHVPARAGDADENLFALARQPAGPATVRLVEVRDLGGLAERPALVVARPADFGDVRLYLVGGVQLDPALAQHLSRLAGAQVRILARGEPTAVAGAASPPTLRRLVRLSPDVGVELTFSRAAEHQARVGLARAVAGFVVLGLLLAALLGWVAARVLTRPLEALAEGARRVASGDLKTPVQARAGGELLELVRAFNQMTDALAGTTAKLMAAERVAAWAEMAKRLAHELKNPLTPIRMSLETLLAADAERSPRFAELFKESAPAMLEEVDRLRRTVDAFSGFARLPKPKAQPLELSEWAGQLLSLHARPRAGLDVRAELGERVWVQADRDQLTQVLVNLVRNAEEAMPGGGRLTVRLRSAAGEALLEVEDTGPGVPEPARAQLFTPYFTTKERGTGLGLALSQRICQEHGGALELDGAHAPGSRFRVRLPLGLPGRAVQGNP